MNRTNSWWEFNMVALVAIGRRHVYEQGRFTIEIESHALPVFQTVPVKLTNANTGDFLERRGARDHLQIWEPRQPVDDALRDSVAQVFRVWITARIREGKHSNRVDAGVTTAAKIQCAHGNECD